MSDLKLRVKEMIIERLKLEGVTPDQIEDDAPLFGDGLGLQRGLHGVDDRGVDV